MNVREFLYKGFEIETTIEENEELIKQCNISIDRLSGKDTGIEPDDKTLKLIKEYEEMRQQAADKIYNAHKMQADILKFINEGLSDPDERRMLRYRYINCLSFEQIGYRLGVTKTAIIKRVRRTESKMKLPPWVKY